MIDPHLDPAALERDLQFAIRAARGAGERALAVLAESRDGEPRWDGALLGDVADQACDGYLQGLIEGRYPDDGVLSEETQDTPERRSHSRVWIVDPLDGTKEYAARLADWAVHVALAIDGAPVLGAVALPMQRQTIFGVALRGHERAGLEGEGSLFRGDTPAASRPRIALSRSHTPPWVAQFVERMGGEALHAGSVGHKVGMLLLGEADMYVHKVGLKEWDTCAPEAIARSLGWHVSRLDGTPHTYNRADPRNHELLVCRPAAAERAIATVRECLAAPTR